MMSNNISCRITRARCWNCRDVIVIPNRIDSCRIPFRMIIPYTLRCPKCGDSIYKYMCRDESQFVH